MDIWLKLCLYAILLIISTNAIEDLPLRTAQRECLNFPKLSSEADTPPPARYEFAHMVTLGYNVSDNEYITFNYGGSLVSDVFVLTSIKAVGWVPRKKPIVVRTGTREFARIDTINEDYDYKVQNYIRYDNYSTNVIELVLLRLEKPVKFSANVYPVCLYTQHNINSETLTVADWNVTEDASSGVQKISLIHTDVKIIPHSESYKTFIDAAVTTTGPSETNHISAKSTPYCNGTSLMYGLLHVNQDEEYILVGVPLVRCYGALPDVYVRVSIALDWIESIVWPAATTTTTTATPPVITTTPTTATPPVITTTPTTATPPVITTTPTTATPPVITTTPTTATPPVITTTPTTATPPVITTTPTTATPPVITTTPTTATPPVITTTPTTATPPVITTTPTTATMPAIILNSL